MKKIICSLLLGAACLTPSPLFAMDEGTIDETALGGLPKVLALKATEDLPATDVVSLMCTCTNMRDFCGEQMKLLIGFAGQKPISFSVKQLQGFLEKSEDFKIKATGSLMGCFRIQDRWFGMDGENYSLNNLAFLDPLTPINFDWCSASVGSATPLEYYRSLQLQFLDGASTHINIFNAKEGVIRKRSMKERAQSNVKSAEASQ